MQFHKQVGGAAHTALTPKTDDLVDELNVRLDPGPGQGANQARMIGTRIVRRRPQRRRVQQADLRQRDHWQR